MSSFILEIGIWRLKMSIWKTKIKNKNNLNRFFPSESAGSSGSPVGPPVQAVQSRFGLHPV